MADKKTFGGRIVVEGADEYKQHLKEIAAEQKVLRAEMKLSTEIHKENADSVEALTEKYEILSKQYETQSKKVEVYSAALEEMSKKRQEAKDNIEALKTSLAEEQEKLEMLTQEHGKNSEEVEKQAKAVEELEKKIATAEQGYDSFNRKTMEWESSLVDARTELVKVEGNLEDTKTRLDVAAKEMDAAGNAAEDLGDDIEEAGKKTSAFGDILKASLVSDILIEGAKQLAEGIKMISSASVDVGSNFEASMSQVAATMGMTASEIENGSKAYTLLSDAAKESGKATKFSASEAAEALNYLALAGYDAEKAAATLPKVLDLAAAGGLDLAYASDLVTDSMAALGMETSELDKYIDQIAKTSQKSNTNIAQLGEATLQCAGMISLTKQSIETMNAELGILANEGIKGAEGGTHLRNVLQSLVAPTDKAAGQLQMLGVQVSSSSGDVRDLNDIMTDLNASLQHMSDSEKTQIISKIFNKTDIAAVNTLLKGTEGAFDDLKKQIIESEGAAADMADTMNANLTGKITILKSALEALGITAYEKIDGTLKDSVDSATEAVGRLQESMESGKLGKSMDDFSDALGDAAESAIDFGEEALPVVIDGLTWILDNSEAVIAGIAGITAAHVEMKYVAPIIEKAAKAWKAYKTVSEEAEVSQRLLNGTIMANPAGLIVAGVVALTTALAVLAITAENSEKEFRKEIDAYEQSRQKIEENIAARQTAKEELENETAVIKQLKSEIAELNAKESLSTEEKQQMLAAVEQLNKAVPELNLAIDEQTGKLVENNEQLEEMIENQLKLREAEAAQEELEDILEDLIEARENLAEIMENQKEKQEELSEAEEKYAEYLEGTNEGLQSVASSYAAASGGAENLTAKIAYLKEQDETYNEEIEKQQGIIDELTGQYNALAESINETNAEMEAATTYSVYYQGASYEIQGATQETIARIENLQTAYADAKAEAYDSISSQVGLFAELKAESDLTVTQMSENLKGQTEVFSQYSEDLVAASKLANEGSNPELAAILSNIMEMGIDGAGYLHELVEAAETNSEEFEEVMSSWAEMEKAKENLSDTMADIQSGYSEGMEEILGIREENEEIQQDSADDHMEEMKRITTEGNDAMVTDATDTIMEMTTVIQTEGPKVKEQVRLLAEDVIKTSETTLQIIDGKSIAFQNQGKAITEGLAQGIRDGGSVVSQAIAEMVSEAINSVDISGISAKIDRILGDALR